MSVMLAEPAVISTPQATACPPALRADARHNRDRILEVARDTFAELGLDVSMAEIARRAGVGVATLYRRFPTKESLATETFTEQLSACVTALDEALADPDAWHGFCAVLRRISAMQAVDHGFRAAFLTAFPGAVAFEQERRQAREGFAELVRRAKAQGELRADFETSDLNLVVLANSGVFTHAGDHGPVAAQRLLAYLIQSFRARPLVPPPSLPDAAAETQP